MTTSGGTGRPTTTPDAHQDEPSEANRTDDGTAAAQGNGAGSAAKASAAYEVAAALRAQASRAADVTKDATNHAQGAGPRPEQDVQAKSGKTGPDTDDSPRDRQASVATAASIDDSPTGAAAAVAATAPTRGRIPPQEPTSPEKPERKPKPAGTTSKQRAKRTEPRKQANSRPTQPGENANPPGSAAVGSGAPPMSNATVTPTPTRPPVVEPGSTKAPPDAEDTQVSLAARPQPPQQPPPLQVPRRVTSPARPTTRVRKARLRLMRLDPWSVMKTAFLLSVAVGITLFVAAAVLWSVLDAAGVFESVSDLVRDLTQSDTSTGVDIDSYLSLSRVLGFTTLIAVVDVVLVTALATLGAFLYNLSASLLGGLEVTLAEDD